MDANKSIVWLTRDVAKGTPQLNLWFEEPELASNGCWMGTQHEPPDVDRSSVIYPGACQIIFGFIPEMGKKYQLEAKS